MVDDFGAELSRMRPLMFVYARTMTDTVPDAEDLVQDVLERALRFRAQFDGQNLKAWLSTIMHNRANDLRRRAMLRQVENIDQLPLAVGDVEREAIAHMQLEVALAGADPVLALSAAQIGRAHV